MTIVHVIEPLAGGMVTFLKSLVENLPDDLHIIVHGERNHVTPFTEVRKQFSYPNVRFIRWKSAQRSILPHKDIPALLELRTILQRLQQNYLLDAIHLHCSKAGFLGRVVCRMMGLQDKVVYTPNGAPFMVGSSWAANFLYKKLERLASWFGGQVVCCSPSEQEAYQKAGIDAITINNGINYEKIIRPAKPIRKKDNIFRVVTSGRIVDQKNPELFNKIASYFEELPHFKFIWVGEGASKHLLNAKNISVTGWLAPEEAGKIVSRADLYLSTAVFEGLSFAVLEALAMSKPMLLSDCVGNKDLVMKGLNGAVFTNEYEAINKILQFYNNTSMLSVMGEHSGAHCKTNFNMVDTFLNYKKLYREACFLPLNKSA